MAKTPTIHNPTHFEPSNYEVIDYLDNKRPQYYGQHVESYAQEVAQWEADMAQALGDDWRKKIGHCVHCGNGRVRWITATLHIPTGERVVFGADCTERLGFQNAQAFKLAQLKARAEAGHARMKVWKQREAYVAAHPEIATAIEQAKGEAHAKNFFVQDVLAKLNQYGSLSDRQASAVVASLAKDVQIAAAKAAQVTEVKGDAPTGRVKVTGTVLSTKIQESDYGPQEKMLMALGNGSRVWVTIPSKASVTKGDTITITATFTPSKDDKSFAFGSRPTL